MKKQSAGRRVRREKIRRKKMQVREKVGKSRNTVFFRGFGGSGGLKSRLAKAAGAETSRGDERWKVARRCGAKPISKWKGTKHLSIGPLLEVEMLKKCTALWREAHLEVKCVKNWGVRSSFGSRDVEKVHAVVARSTFRKSKCYKTPQAFGPLLEVEIDR